MSACHHVKPSAIRELPVKYVEMFEFIRIPCPVSTSECDVQYALRTVIVEGPESPRSATCFDGFDVIIDPSCQFCFGANLEIL